MKPSKFIKYFGTKHSSHKGKPFEKKVMESGKIVIVSGTINHGFERRQDVSQDIQQQKRTRMKASDADALKLNESTGGFVHAF